MAHLGSSAHAKKLGCKGPKKPLQNPPSHHLLEIDMAMTITQEQRDTFIKDAAARFIERGGYESAQALECAKAFDVDEFISDGVTGSDAADEDMSYWGD